MLEYRHVEGNCYLKIKIEYDKGGMNYFTSKVDARGYYLYVIKVKRTTDERGFTMESFAMYTGGRKKLLLEVKRKSEGAYKKAVELAKNEVENMCFLVKQVC